MTKMRREQRVAVVVGVIVIVIVIVVVVMIMMMMMIVIVENVSGVSFDRGRVRVLEEDSFFVSGDVLMLIRVFDRNEFLVAFQTLVQGVLLVAAAVAAVADVVAAAAAAFYATGVQFTAANLALIFF